MSLKVEDLTLDDTEGEEEEDSISDCDWNEDYDDKEDNDTNERGDCNNTNDKGDYEETTQESHPASDDEQHNKPGAPIVNDSMTVIDNTPPAAEAEGTNKSSLKAFKKGLTKPIRSIRKKLKRKKKDKNAVQEISLQPETEQDAPKECWVTPLPSDVTSDQSSSGKTGSRRSKRDGNKIEPAADNDVIAVV